VEDCEAEGQSEIRELKAIASWIIIGPCHLPAQTRRAAMTSNSQDIVQQVQPEFHALVAYVTGPAARVQTA
jgi:hypothetical protein